MVSTANNLGESIQYNRDAMGNVTSISLKGSAVVAQRSQVFDELGRLMRSLGALGQTWSFAYDRTDNLVSTTDPRSKVYNSAFDALNRLSTETNPESAVVTLTYNGKDEVTGYDDPQHVHTTYVRDGFGDVIRRDSPDTGITDYWYDPRGLLTKMVDARAVETDFTYDNAGRRLTKTFPAAPGENVAYSYDGGNRGVGRLTGITEVAGGPGTKWGGFNWGGAPWTAGYFATFKYVARGNLIQEQRSIGGVSYTLMTSPTV